MDSFCCSLFVDDEIVFLSIKTLNSRNSSSSFTDLSIWMALFIVSSSIAAAIHQSGAKSMEREPGIFQLFSRHGKIFCTGLFTIASLLPDSRQFSCTDRFSFIRSKEKIISQYFVSWLSLTITFFYSFLDVSYVYLFYTPVLVSLVIEDGR